MSTRDARMADKVLNKQNSKVFSTLLACPTNKYCADCHKKDPRWASWNLGVWVCIRCSGIHRSIGTHISKVKSVDLDCWTPDQVESMQRWGNRRANAYWEANVPPGRAPTDGNIENWIRSKYERKAFTRPGPVPDPESLGIPADGSDGGSVGSSGSSTKSNLGSSTSSATSSRGGGVDDLIGGLEDDGFGSSPSTLSSMTSTPPPQAAPVKASTGGMNDLDALFSSPVTSSNPSQSRVNHASPNPTSTPSPRPGQVPDLGGSNDALKSYIMSLYSKPPSGGASPHGGAGGGGGGMGGLI